MEIVKMPIMSTNNLVLNGESINTKTIKGSFDFNNGYPQDFQNNAFVSTADVANATNIKEGDIVIGNATGDDVAHKISSRDLSTTIKGDWTPESSLEFTRVDLHEEQMLDVTQDGNTFTFEQIAPDLEGGGVAVLSQATLPVVPDKFSVTYNFAEPLNPAFPYPMGYYSGMTAGVYDAPNGLYPTAAYSWLQYKGGNLTIGDYMGDGGEVEITCPQPVWGQDITLTFDLVEREMGLWYDGVLQGTCPLDSGFAPTTLSIGSYLLTQDEGDTATITIVDRTIEGFEPIVVGGNANYPENAANNAFILVVANPVFIPELNKELENGDIVIFDGNGHPLRAIQAQQDALDAALTKTFTPWQPEVTGTDIDETKYPQNPQGKGYEITGLTQPVQWDALGREVKNGDFIVFDNDGMPKEIGGGGGGEVDLSEYTKRSEDETITGDWEFTGGISVGDAKFGVPFKPNFAPTAFPTAFSFNSTENVSVNLFDVDKGSYYLMATRTDADFYDDGNPIDSVAFVIGAQSESGDVAGLSLAVGDSGEIDASLTIHNNGASYSLGLDENGKGYLGGGSSRKYLATEDFVKDSKTQVKEIVTENKTLTAADSGKLLIINADGITITMPASSNFNVDIAKMDESFITIVQSAGTDKFREGTDTISVIRDVSITNSGIAGKEWLAIGAYEV